MAVCKAVCKVIKFVKQTFEFTISDFRLTILFNLHIISFNICISFVNRKS